MISLGLLSGCLWNYNIVVCLSDEASAACETRKIICMPNAGQDVCSIAVYL